MVTGREKLPSSRSPPPSASPPETAFFFPAIKTAAPASSPLKSQTAAWSFRRIRLKETGRLKENAQPGSYEKLPQRDGDLPKDSNKQVHPKGVHPKGSLRKTASSGSNPQSFQRCGKIIRQRSRRNQTDSSHQPFYKSRSQYGPRHV